MKNIYCVILLVNFFTHSIYAETIISEDNVSGIWDIAGSPYLIEGDITIQAGSILTINPGVVIEFQSWYKLTVYGELQAVGTPAEQIIFTATPPGSGEPGWVGIDFIDANSPSNLEYCIIENGKATASEPNDRGGAIYLINSSPNIKNCTLRNNTVSKYGGGIYCDNSSPLIENCTITENTVGYASFAGGGGIYCTNNSQPRIIGNIIGHNSVNASGGFNSANSRGGAIYLSNSDAIIEKNLISSNSLESAGYISTHSQGGAIYISNSEPNIVGNTFSDNSVINNGQNGEGGCLFIYNSNPNSVNNIFWDNSPQEIFFSESGSSSIMISYSDVKGGINAIITNGAGIINWEEGNINEDPLFDDAENDQYQLQSGSPAIDGGTAFYEWQGETLVNLSTDDYTGDAPDMGAYESNDEGPNQHPVAVVSSDRDHGSSPLTIHFSSDGSYDPDGTIIEYLWNFDDGTSSSDPNPVHTFNEIKHYDVKLTVTDDNNATDTDVIIVTVQDGKTIWGGDVSGDWAISKSPYRIEGDITIPNGQTLTIEPGVRVEFQDWYKMTINGQLQAVGTKYKKIVFSATPPGSGEPGWIGIFFIDSPDFSNLEYCVIENAKAAAGDPNDRGGAINIQNSNPRIMNCDIQNNRVSRYGAAIYCDNGKPVIEGCNITDNLAGYLSSAGGGALYFINNSHPIIISNFIDHNTVSASGGFSSANGRGGAIYLSESDAQIEYNIISENLVEASGNIPSNGQGGGIYAYYSDINLIGNTFSGNEASINSQEGEGGAIFAHNSNVNAVNNIFWNNIPQEIVCDATIQKSIMISYSDVKGGESEIITAGSSTIFWQEGNINNDPLFIDPSVNDYNLNSNSPAIDAGIDYYEWNEEVLLDLNTSEYQGAAPDMGGQDYIMETPTDNATLNLRVFLEGPFNSSVGNMNNDLGVSIPLSQPFNISPWNYQGSESVSEIPIGVVDWVLIELRDGNTASEATNILSRRAVFINSDGYIIELDGSENIVIENLSAGEYYVVIIHRNHLPVMSSFPLTISN